MPRRDVEINRRHSLPRAKSESHDTFERVKRSFSFSLVSSSDGWRVQGIVAMGDREVRVVPPHRVDMKRQSLNCRVPTPWNGIRQDASCRTARLLAAIPVPIGVERPHRPRVFSAVVAGIRGAGPRCRPSLLKVSSSVLACRRTGRCSFMEAFVRRRLERPTGALLPNADHWVTLPNIERVKAVAEGSKRWCLSRSADFSDVCFRAARPWTVPVPSAELTQGHSTRLG